MGEKKIMREMQIAETQETILNLSQTTQRILGRYRRKERASRGDIAIAKRYCQMLIADFDAILEDRTK